MKLRVDQELWDELELPWNYVDRVHTGERRWFDDYDVIFEHDGKYWSVSIGFTKSEMGDDEGPLEYEDHFFAQQVEKKEVITTAWVPVEA